MKENILIVLLTGLFLGCTTVAKHEVVSSSTKESKSTTAQAHAKENKEADQHPAIVVQPQDLALLEKMAAAIEEYVVKGEKGEFTVLCRNKKFDCFVDEKLFPAKKKTVLRRVPPFSSGSKMGLQGEKRVSVRYDFYPRTEQITKKKKRHR